MSSYGVSFTHESRPWLAGLVMVIAALGACESGKPQSVPASRPAQPKPTAARQPVIQPLSEADICAQLRRSFGSPPPLATTPSIEATLLVSNGLASREGDAVRASAELPLRIVGITNLPEGTELNLDLSNDIGPSASESATVNDNCFVSTELGSLPSGSYELVVGTLCLDVQPAPVQKITGSNGQRLKGPLVRKSRLCTTVERSQLAMIGASVADVTQAEAARRSTLAKRREKILWLSKEGAAMGPLRLGSVLRNGEAATACAKRMRALRQEVDSLRAQSDSDTWEANKPLGAQVMNLYDCVSCSEVGDQACAKIQVALNE